MDKGERIVSAVLCNDSVVQAVPKLAAMLNLNSKCSGVWGFVCLFGLEL